MKDARLGEKIVGQLRHPRPHQSCLLTAPTETPVPENGDVVAESTDRRAVRRHGVVGEIAGWRSWPTISSPSRASFIPGRMCASPSDTRGRSRVPELGSLGSVRGASSNERSYREHIEITPEGRPA